MKWILALVICISFNSCIPYPSMHYSVAQNVPLLTEKGETRFSVSTGNEAIGIQGAYAFSNSLAVMASYSGGLDETSPPGYISDGGFDNGSRRSGEIAFGYFEPIGKKGVIEAYAGIERYYRSFSNDWFPTGVLYTSTFSTYCTKPFVQVDLGLNNVGHHSFGLSMKIGVLEYDHLSYMVSDSTGRMSQHASDYNSSPSVVVEPCFTYRLGGKHLSFQAQAGLSITASQVNTINSGSGLSEPFFFNAGLSVRLFKEKNVKVSDKR